MVIIIGVLICLFLIVGFGVIVIMLMLLRKSRPPEEFSTPLQNFTQTLQEVKTNTAVLGEKIEGLSKRVGVIEQTSSQATAGIAASLSDAKTSLAELKAYVQSREDIQNQASKSLQRLELVIAGTKTKGNAGENIVEAILSSFPTEWQVHGFTVQGKICEFGLRLPNSNLVLPIDSKWAATQLIEDFAKCQDVDEKQRIKNSIEKAVLAKAKEVQKYIDSQLTVSFGVAVIPDAAYEVCGAALGESLNLDVVVVSHSMLVPYLMPVVHIILKNSQNVDIEKFSRYVHDLESCVKNIQTELENRHARGLTMIQNARDDMKGQASKMSNLLSSIKVGSGLTVDENLISFEEVNSNELVNEAISMQSE